MATAPTFVFSLELPTWSYADHQASSGWTATADLPSADSPATLYPAPYGDLVDFSSFLVAKQEEPSEAIHLIEQPAAAEDHESSSPSSPDGTPTTHRSPRSSWSGASEPSDVLVAPEAMDRLMQLIAWPAGGARAIHAKKRPRSEHEYSKEKHLQTEKRRREDMSEAIDTIHRIMPESRMEKKLTKVDILQDAALYFAKLQAVALQLVEENNALRARAKAAADAANGSATAALL